MPTCIKLRGTKTQVCAGDLRFQIEIQERNLAVPTDPFVDDQVNYGEEFTTLHSVFSMIETPLGVTTFNDVGISTAISHVFYVRHLDDVDAQKWILFDEIRYKIVNVTNLEARKIFLKIECVESGSQDKDASRA